MLSANGLYLRARDRTGVVEKENEGFGIHFPTRKGQQYPVFMFPIFRLSRQTIGLLLSRRAQLIPRKDKTLLLFPPLLLAQWDGAEQIM